jgi:hypothetical protein
MGEQIKRYQTSFSADDDVVLASDHDREIAQRDARIVELEGDLNIARLERDAKLCTECPRGSVQAERDTAREMLRDARKLEAQACWDAINAHIKTGQLYPPGQNEQRNGMVLASNLVMQRITEHSKE